MLRCRSSVPGSQTTGQSSLTYAHVHVQAFCLHFELLTPLYHHHFPDFDTQESETRDGGSRKDEVQGGVSVHDEGEKLSGNKQRCISRITLI